jgi:hypothetical protein
MLDCTLQDLTLIIVMEYEQRVIIKFLFNEGADARQIAERLRAQFHEMRRRCLRSNFGLYNCDRVEKTFTTSAGREDLQQNIFQPKSKNY